ncbi:DUF3986 family protein [Brevibacillus ginsengisoli]|uniref:DUF3986 family protein n=1 Tax=Brevibacillus ginsengisoli TaxID=363854 RepID=UPI003CF3F035
MATNTVYFDETQYDFSVQKKIDNFLTPYIPYVEAVAIKRKNNPMWDVFFNQFDDQIEQEYLLGKHAPYLNETLGMYCLSAPEDVVEDRFREWAENEVMQFRRQRND